MAAFITGDQLAARVSRVLLTRALDDGGAGLANSAALAQLLLDASNKVRAGCGFVFDIDTIIDQNPPVAGELQRIALDAAHAYLAQRHPEVIKIDAEKLLKRVDADLEKLRTARSNMATPNSPTPDRVAGIVVDCGRRVTIPNLDGTGGLGDF